jgi:hypothetical protein
MALERKQRRALVLWKAWERAGVTLTVPAVVIAEWWRDRQWDAARWLDGVEVEPVDESLARTAGEVLGELRLGREHTIDAIVMASNGEGSLRTRVMLLEPGQECADPIRHRPSSVSRIWRAF